MQRWAVIGSESASLSEITVCQHRVENSEGFQLQGLVQKLRVSEGCERKEGACLPFGIHNFGSACAGGICTMWRVDKSREVKKRGATKR